MTDKEKTIKELKEALDSLDITNKYRLNLIRAIEYLQEELVSEDLEKTVDDYTRKVLERTNCLIGNQPVGEEISKAVEFGAKWQKQKDDREIKIVRELLADFDKHCDEYHEAGFKHGQEALMKDAVEAVCDVTIHTKGDEVHYSVHYPVGKRPFHKGDKVKLIIIKED